MNQRAEIDRARNLLHEFVEFLTWCTSPTANELEVEWAWNQMENAETELKRLYRASGDLTRGYIRHHVTVLGERSSFSLHDWVLTLP